MKTPNSVSAEPGAGHIFTFDTKSVGSRLIAYLNQGTWSRVGICSGNGCVLEAITSGVTERSIEAYHHPRYRLGIYRLSGSPAQIDKMIEFAESQLGKSYAFKKALKLGVRMILGNLAYTGRAKPCIAKHGDTRRVSISGCYLTRQLERRCTQHEPTRSPTPAAQSASYHPHLPSNC